MFDCVAILGPGLLGGSLGLALQARSLARRVQVWARRPESRQACAATDWCDATFAEPAEAVQGAELVVVAAPVSHIVELIERAATGLKPGALVTDVGSTKGEIARRAHALMPEGVHFVGSHPMAGSEKSGLAHAHAELYQDRACLVTPLEQTDPAAHARICQFWRNLGMEVTSLSPDTHDEIVAHISHLPHALASVLCAQLAQRDTHWLAYAGGGLRDTTRIAAGSPSLWRDIFCQNRDEVLRALNDFDAALQDFRRALSNRDDAQLRLILEQGKAYRDQLPG